MHHSFWAHYCPCEKGVLWVAREEECNWCGLTCDPVLADSEADVAPIGRDPSLATKGSPDGRFSEHVSAKRLRG